MALPNNNKKPTQLWEDTSKAKKLADEAGAQVMKKMGYGDKVPLQGQQKASTPQPPVKGSENAKTQTILKQNQQRISPMGVKGRDAQIKAAQDALQARRAAHGDYDSSGTN